MQSSHYLSSPWLILADALPGEIEKGRRANGDRALGLRPVESLAGRPLPARSAVKNGDEFDAVAAGTPRVWRSGGVAVVELKGVIYSTRSALVDVLCWAFGGVVLEDCISVLERVVADKTVSSIVLDFDSPGGQAGGVAAAADSIRTMSRRKPIHAYTSGVMCSAAYWLGAAASRVVAHPGATVGSIGAVLSLVDDREAMKADGVVEHTFTSAVSPDKRPDPATAQGATLFQELVDNLGEQFVAAVAKYRGVSATVVKRDFGRGWVMSAGRAKQVGMLDQVGTLEATVAALSAGRQASGSSPQAATVPAAGIVSVGVVPATAPKTALERALAAAFANPPTPAGVVVGRAVPENAVIGKAR